MHLLKLLNETGLPCLAVAGEVSVTTYSVACQFPDLVHEIAGPERSGSTWLFNAIRLLYEEAQVPLDSYWITHLTDEKLQQRACGEGFPMEIRAAVSSIC